MATLTDRLVPRRSEPEPAPVVAVPLRSDERSIPDLLRLLADRIEAGKHGRVLGAAVVLERPYADDALIGGFGEADDARHCHHLLTLGSQRLGWQLMTGTVRREV
jgi:hypothetical protein